MPESEDASPEQGRTIPEQGRQIEQLNSWDFPDTASVMDGWGRETVPLATQPNMRVLINKVNELVDAVNEARKSSDGCQ